tara:strand:- start:1356 stop:2180 length:825 start_codon:yes stop_codon:yes gene_type:complete
MIWEIILNKHNYKYVVYMVFSLANPELLSFLYKYRVFCKEDFPSSGRAILDYSKELTVFIIYWINILMIAISFAVYIITKHNPFFESISRRLYHTILYMCGIVLTNVNKYVQNCYFKKIIYERTNNTPYLERFYLFLKNRDTFFFNIFLHRFLNSDQDDIHDHPWGFFHIVISGGYWEYITVNEDGTTLDQGIKKVWRSPGYYNIVSSQYKHRIVLSDEKPWTLFIPFERHDTWNFWIPLVWKNGEPCTEGDINDDDVLKSTKWKCVPHHLYKK